MLAADLRDWGIGSATVAGAPLTIAQPFAAIEAHPTLNGVLLSELIEGYFDAHAHRMGKRTRQKYQRTLRLLAEPRMPTTLDGWTPEAAQAAYTYAYKTYGWAIGRQLRNHGRAAWFWGSKLGRAPSINPWQLVETIPDKRRLLRFDEGWLPRAIGVVEQLRASEEISAVVGRFAVNAMSCGCRPWTELLRVRVRDVDLARGELIFAATKGRDGQTVSRAIPLDVLTPVARAALEAQLELAVDFLWPPLRGDAETMDKRTVLDAWAEVIRPALSEAGLCTQTIDGKPINFYDATRHAFASYAVGELGLSREQVSLILGHTDRDTIDHYVHLSTDHARPVACAISKALCEAVGSGGGGGGQERWGVQGDRVRSARNAAGLTQAQVAKACEVTVSSVSGWEGGKAQPSTIALHRLSKATGRSTDFFFGEASR